MRKIFEILNKFEPLKGDYGIEIEAEGQGMKMVNNKWWGTHDDGSLRGVFPDSRAEFVLNAPVLKRSVGAVLRNLNKELEGAKFNFSFRTSVHVHMNAQELTYNEVLNVIYTYLLLEEPFLTFCGKNRKGNRFCLRLQDAEGLLDTVNSMINAGERGLDVINQENVRYASINLGALIKYGSIEFRAMRGTVDVDVISTWIDALHKVREYAKSVKDITAVYEEFRDKGPEGFLQHVLGDVVEKFTYARVSRDIERSYSLSLDVPFAYKEFVKAQERRAKDAEKKGVQKGKAAKHILPDIPIPNNNWVLPEALLRVRREVLEMHEAGRIKPEYKDWIRINDKAFYEYVQEKLLGAAPAAVPRPGAPVPAVEFFRAQAEQ